MKYQTFVEFFDQFESGRNYFNEVSLNELAIDYLVGKGQIDLDLFLNDLNIRARKLPPMAFEIRDRDLRGKVKSGIHHGELKSGLGSNDNAAIIRHILGTGRQEFENTLMPNFSASGSKVSTRKRVQPVYFSSEVASEDIMDLQKALYINSVTIFDHFTKFSSDIPNLASSNQTAHNKRLYKQ